MTRLIKRIFIANRGEIARRIAITAKKMKIETVIVCENGNTPKYIKPYIDHIHWVEEEQTSLYLNGQMMIEIAKKHDCDAIHPGFGFLSENEQFAKDVETAGMIWIGPSSESIASMASKASARDIAEDENIPLVPGFKIERTLDSLKSNKKWQDFISECDYPILIKAALGGGGKGMRVVRKECELDDSLQRAASEAKASFGSDSLIVEKYLETPRHIEVQIFGDKSGQCISIGDRDCSMQRRHQKIIEEAPAPFLHPETRAKMHDYALRLARRVGYYSAGTVEFLVDGPSRQEQDVYFLEMNTRLQVEHPVTEQVYDTDLVALQIKIAQGECLKDNFRPKNIEQIRRHSIEARIYAEDPLQNFMPAPGFVYAFIPYTGENIRWEIGLDQYDAITTKFDPMIAKLVVTADSRESALEKLGYALKKTIMCGPKTNLSFLKTLSELQDFKQEGYDTFYIQRNLEKLKDRIELTKNLHANMIDITSYTDLINQLYSHKNTNRHSEFRRRAFQQDSLLNTSEFNPIAQYTTNLYPRAKVVAGYLQTDAYGEHAKLPIAFVRSPDKDLIWINANGIDVSFDIDRHQSHSDSSTSSADENVKSPVPGKVILKNCSENMKCSRGQTLLVMESMKMEIEIKAPFEGTINKIYVEEGDQVDADHLLFELHRN